jgi:predicted TIM-barrel fold metal-dependent hydrolase
MHIDIFAHILPEKFYQQLVRVSSPGVRNMQKRVRDIPALYDLGVRYRIMDQFRDYVQVLTLSSPPIEALGGPGSTPDWARLANDTLAETVTRAPKRFPGFIASLPMNAPDAAMNELARAIDHLGARGIQIFSNVCGKPLDRSEFAPIFAEMARRDLPIWLHPARDSSFSDYADESNSRFEMWWVFGWPYETTLAMARIAFAGYFDRYPNLKIITHHGGAMVPFFSGRIGPGLDALGTRTPDEQQPALTKHSLKRRPFDYFKMFYADTALFGAPHGVRCALDFFGAEQILFATDFPFDPEKGSYNIRATIADLNTLALDANTRTAIEMGNAQRLLNL